MTSKSPLCFLVQMADFFCDVGMSMISLKSLIAAVFIREGNTQIQQKKKVALKLSLSCGGELKGTWPKADMRG